MEFIDTPVAAHPIAERFISHYLTLGYSVRVEIAIKSDAPFRTTLICSRGLESILVEAQDRPVYNEDLRNLANWLAHNQLYASLVIGTLGNRDLPGGIIQELKRDGVGLAHVDQNGEIDEVVSSRIYALAIPYPSVPLGAMKSKINGLVKRFNIGHHKDTLRDMFELVERETGKLIHKAAKRKVIDKDVSLVVGMDWSNQINVLAAADRYPTGRAALISPKLKDDLHSFRGARNLIDHPVNGAKAENKRELQFVERMIQGPRLLWELLAAGRKV